MLTRAFNHRLPATLPAQADDRAGIERLARWMDSAFTLPGTNIRFGFDALIGLLPGAGDTIATLVSLYILGIAQRAGASKATLLRMGVNIAADLLVGAIPVLGDLFDVYFQANRRNVALLARQMAAAPGEVRRLERRDRWFVWMVIGVLVLMLSASVYAAGRLVAWIGSALLGS
ncbi:MAG: DUF4112 domain-containing protein [Planctomycetota bacterium]|nr:MAG: DUF4112 domain-containing protein [Planctomycetota bacterium]